MPPVNLKNMDVDALLELRANVESMLAERGRDLQRQLALLDGGDVRRGRPAGRAAGRPDGRAGRVSAMRGVKVPPKYRGPGGETWAGRGATPRWLSALLKEGHSVEEFLIGAGRKRKAAAGKKPTAKMKGRKATHKKRAQNVSAPKEQAEAAS
jgi:DNA-binding protein H-NS